ncbi:MAG: O-antigen ligase family protein, partial [Pirellulaceae bacterium]|nr:O-antigen ligase family protein [Pirellulaceae bacterium]
FTSIFVFTPTALGILGTRRFFEIALGSFLLTMVVSWLLYFLMPEYGMKLEGIDDAGSTMQRMSGTSHPNTLAGIAGFALLIVAGFLHSKCIRWKVALPLILFCLATLFMCRTRVAPIAVVMALAVVFRGFWFRRDVFPYAIVLVAMGLLVSLAVFIYSAEIPQAFAERFARSGEVEELTSVTGRNKIWIFVIEKIRESPLVGYGPGAAKNILAKEELLLHPHNVVLAVSIAGGALAGWFAIMMFLQQLWMSLRRAIPLIGLVSVFIFLNSLTETFIFGYFPGSSTIIWLAALYWFDLDDESLAPADVIEPGSPE